MPQVVKKIASYNIIFIFISILTDQSNYTD